MKIVLVAKNVFVAAVLVGATTPAWARLVEVTGPIAGPDARVTYFDAVFETSNPDACTAAARLQETPAGDRLYLTCPLLIASESEFRAADIVPAVAAPRQPGDYVSAQFDEFELVCAPPEVVSFGAIVLQTFRDESKVSSSVWATLTCLVGEDNCSTTYLRAQAASVRFPHILRARISWQRYRPIDPVCYPDPICPGTGPGPIGGG